MTTTVLKNEITKALQDINDKSFLEALYTIINSRREKFDYELTEEDMHLLDERKALYKSGNSKTYTVKEVREKIEKNLSK